MRKLLTLFLALFMAICLGAVMVQHSGYVVVAYDDVAVESSLWFALLALLCLFCAFYLLLRMSGKLSYVVSVLRGWRLGRRIKQARQQTILAIYDLFEGNWERSEKRLVNFAKHSDMQMINYLVAAFVANKLGAVKRRNHYLSLAEKLATEPGLAVVVCMLKARLAVQNGEWREAIALLVPLRDLRPRNHDVLILLKDAYWGEGDWLALADLLPELRKHRVLADKDFSHLEVQVYRQLLTGTLNAATGVDQLWRNMPRALQRNNCLVAQYVEWLLKDHSRHGDAEELLKLVLGKKLEDNLLKLYAAVNSQTPLRHLERAEKWLSNHGCHGGLLLALGRICRKQKLWGKARGYLEEAIRVSNDPEAFLELADFSSQQGDNSRALGLYKHVLSLDGCPINCDCE